MAPMISVITKKNNKIKKMGKQLKNEKEKLIKLRNYVEQNFEYVGENFSKKVREIYYDKKNNKTIYGTTTSKEREELKEEGIDLISIPWVNKDNQFLQLQIIQLTDKFSDLFHFLVKGLNSKPFISIVENFLSYKFFSSSSGLINLFQS